MSGSTVLPCTCASSFQDERYGRGMRVHTVGAKGTKSDPSMTCTVCGTKRTGSAPKAEGTDEAKPKKGGKKGGGK